MNVIELSMCDADREKYGGPEWVSLDVDRLYDTPASYIERWERETGGYAIERALAEGGGFAPAKAVRVLMWLARKQSGANADAVDPDTGDPESFARLADLRTLQVRIRRARPELPEDDAVPPSAPAEATSGD